MPPVVQIWLERGLWFLAIVLIVIAIGEFSEDDIGPGFAYTLSAFLIGAVAFIMGFTRGSKS